MKKKRNNNSKNSNVIPFPNLENRLLDKGMEALKEKRYKEALQIFHQFTTYNEGYPEVEVGIVVCLLELGLYEDAKNKCEQLLQQDVGDYYNVLQIYITILIQLSEYDQVVSILEALFEEEKVPEHLAGELFHLLEFSRKSSEHRLDTISQNEPAPKVQALGQQLVNGTMSEQFQAVQDLRKAETLNEIMQDVRDVLADHYTHPIIQSMVLQLLMEKEMDDVVVVHKFDRIVKVNPKTVVNIFEQPFTIQVLNKVEDILSHENPTLYESVKEVWERFLFVLFPFLPEPLEVKVWAGALHKFGHQLFGIEISDSELVDLYSVDIEQIESSCQQIMDVERISGVIFNGE